MNPAIGLAAVEARASASRGISANAIYRMVERALEETGASGGALLDVGCGAGNLWPVLERRFQSYVGVDAVRYAGFPANGEFVKANLDEPAPLPAGSARVTVAVETIEHLENPRAFVRELVRLTEPGGWIVVTTPNQRSMLSMMTLLVKGQHGAFQSADYPAHITALLEIDLERIATECGLGGIRFFHSQEGRVPFTGVHYPGWLSAMFPRAFSGNVAMVARKPHA
ncbi:MAG: class I SAM-dependent methyltransferase [Bryobacteraceae bacterium]